MKWTKSQRRNFNQRKIRRAELVAKRLLGEKKDEEDSAFQPLGGGHQLSSLMYGSLFALANSPRLSTIITGMEGV